MDDFEEEVPWGDGYVEGPDAAGGVRVVLIDQLLGFALAVGCDLVGDEGLAGDSEDAGGYCFVAVLEAGREVPEFRE